jgi:hypothetical protein
LFQGRRGTQWGNIRDEFSATPPTASPASGRRMIAHLVATRPLSSISSAFWMNLITVGCRRRLSRRNREKAARGEPDSFPTNDQKPERIVGASKPPDPGGWRELEHLKRKCMPDVRLRKLSGLYKGCERGATSGSPSCQLMTAVARSSQAT